MTGITDIRGTRMPCWLEMTTGTGANDLAVIQRSDIQNPRCWSDVVAAIAKISRRRVIAWFTCRYDVIVTAYTGTYDLGVIHRTANHRRPLRRKYFMTGITHVSRIYV